MTVEAAVRAQDAWLRERGLSIWIGAEPTFTLRSSQEPEWLFAAEGPQKEERARALLLALMPRNAILMRCVGRRYPGEERARFSYGAYFRRDGASAWDGPPDPLVAKNAEPSSCGPDELRDALAAGLTARGAQPQLFAGPAQGLRIAYGNLSKGDLRMRRSAHAKGPVAPAFDDAAAQGLFVAAVQRQGASLAVELPGFRTPAELQDFLAALAAAARRLELPELILRGFPPPVDEHTTWLTVTPDPGVVEVNLAPAPDLATFHEYTRAVYAAALQAGLSPERFRFNGHAADSGGGGQLTFGGPSPADSPFLRHRHLLTGLVRAAGRHPSLSYLFCTECIGGASQGPRADEGVRERFEELSVALDRIDAVQHTPEQLWQALAPLLVDSAGNPHRAEINVEKLWSPTRRLGLVELRALRMQPQPERQLAVAALFRALLARLANDPLHEPLADWGAELHDRFSLPHFLLLDLREVLIDLAAHGLSLGPLEEVLLQPPEPIARVQGEGAELEIAPALEFWPLLGDVASQEQRDARLVDSSAARLQLKSKLAEEISIDGWRVPLYAAGDAHVAGVRYRAFAPQPGLHPGLAPHDPLIIHWRDARIELHGWIPGGGAYPGLPADAAEAAQRRADRVLVTRGLAPPPARDVPSSKRGKFCVDLRRL